MTKYDIEQVEKWLLRREKTFLGQGLRGFLPDLTDEQLIGAQRAFTLLLQEANTEKFNPL